MTKIIFPGSSEALAKKHLSKHLLKKLENKKTRSGFTLARALASGIKNPDSSIGIYAGDTESYQTFSAILDPVIFEYHNGLNRHKLHGEISRVDLPDPDPEQNFILSTRIRVARNLEGFAFPCHIRLSSRKIVEQKIRAALESLPAGLKGTYTTLEDILKLSLEKRPEPWLIFKKGDRFQDAAGINRDFPLCRGAFYSRDKNFIVWVNEEDHLRIISMEQTADISRVFNRLEGALTFLNCRLDFAWSESYGHLASCPTNIGTAMRAGVHIRLENLQQNPDILSDIIKKHSLQIRGTAGEKTPVKKAVFDISNKQRLGVSEADIIKNLHKGICALIRAEKKLS